MKLKAGTIKRIHVNQLNMRANRKDNGNRPVFSVRTSRGTFYGKNVKLHGPAEFIDSTYKPLSCGARIWCATKSAVTISK